MTRKVVKVSHKRPHGDARRVAGVASKSLAQKDESVYRAIDGSFRVLYPVTQTKISRKRLSDAVVAVVSKMKT